MKIHLGPGCVNLINYIMKSCFTLTGGTEKKKQLSMNDSSLQKVLKIFNLVNPEGSLRNSQVSLTKSRSLIKDEESQWRARDGEW